MAWVAAAAGGATGADGKFVGSFHRTTGAEEQDVLRMRYDIGTREQIPAGFDLDLRTSLQFSRRPGESNSDLLRSRFFGEARRSGVRFYGNFVPWQEITSGEGGPEEHNLQLGLALTPRKAPQLDFGYNRQRRARSGVVSESEDRRARISYALGGLTAQASVRRLDASAEPALQVPARTDEVRAGMSGLTRIGPVSLSGDYEAAFTDFESADRRRDTSVHGAHGNAAWAIHPRFSAIASAVGRWGHSDDNSRPGREEIEERYLSGGAQYRPWNSLDLSALREHRRSAAATSVVDTDYLQFDSSFRKPIRRGLQFQSGYRHTVATSSDRGEIPNRSANALIDGRLREHIDGRFELRASKSATDEIDDTRWVRLAQLRTRPSRGMRVEATWTRTTTPIAVIEAPDGAAGDTTAPAADTLTVVRGVSQNDNQWEIVTSYEPARAMSFVLALRALDGSGRIARDERFASLTTTWRLARSANLSGSWSRRLSESDYTVVAATGDETLRVVRESSDTVVGLDLSGRIARDIRYTGSWREISGNSRPSSDTYSVNLERTF
ncbi:MAG: hypothetical protein ACKVU1_17265 [bacterium]